MIQMSLPKKLLCTALLLTLAGGISANPDRLGQDLTPVGAERAGNAAGTIPEWTGGISQSNDRFTNPFANEQPLFVITAANYQEHRAHLTDGQVAMFQRYPDTFRMPVYPTHRTAALPEHIYEAGKANARNARLTEDGNGLLNFNEALAFPIPENGLQVIWNHMTRYRGGALERNFVQVPVQANGTFTPVRINEKLSWPSYLLDANSGEERHDNILFYFVQEVTAPARLTGTILLVHETMNQIQQPRQAWTYNSGQRRVRLAPNIAYDAPGTATDGMRTTDNLDMFNGAPDRYNWTLVGKKEIYIPYNSWKLTDRSLSYSDIIQPGHLNPDLTRYELHRVWHVEATLKDGQRHVYGKRTFYIDEDSWQIATVDHYDGRGELWRVGEMHKVMARDVMVPWTAAETFYDLQSGRYLVGGLTNEERVGYDFTQRFNFRDFTPQAIRRAGR